MKLKNKLLPLVGIAATAAVVAPLVTSCKSAYDMIDITKGYTPKTQSSVAGEKNQQEATQTYIDDVKKNPEIFKEDFIYGVYEKVKDIKTEFLNSPDTWEDDIEAANFKLNSLKAGVSNPTFGSTKIAYPGEPVVPYPTVSFEYKIQMEYTYEYVGGMEASPAWQFEKTEGYFSESDGYHGRTVVLDVNVKYNNVPFLAIAHTDGLSTYWQVTPLDTTTIYAKENNIETLHYYSQAYMFQYMSDDWSIDLNASVNQTHKSVTYDGEHETESTFNFNQSISDYDSLKNLYYYQERYSHISADEAYDLANFYDMLLTVANWGFKSYYLDSVVQKPEIQTNGHMQGFGDISDKTASFGAFYLPQSFTGDVQLYAKYNETTGVPEGAIELSGGTTLAPVTLTIAEGTKLTNTSSGDYTWQYGVENATLAYETAPEAGTMTFELPKTIVAKFVPTTGDSFTQLVYINQNTLKIALEA